MPDATTTRMFQEAREAPARVQAQIDADTQLIARIAAALRAFQPRMVLTSARGSSDHAATFARYLIETGLGLVTSSASPSLSSVYAARQDLDQCLFLVISQSGRSPDLLTAAAAAKASGALVLALVNAEDLPLAAAADHVIPLRAGPELSVAATKSYICALAAIVHLVAHWGANPSLLGAFASLPAQLDASWQLDWQPMVETLKPAQKPVRAGPRPGIGRGAGSGIEIQGNLRPARRSLQQCGSPAWADGTLGKKTAGPDVRPG